MSLFMESVNRSLHPAIRPALPHEARLLGNLALRSKAFWGYPVEFIESCRNELTYSAKQIGSAESSFAVAEIAGMVVGFCALENLSSSEVELDALFVDPEWTGRGIGRQLLEHARRVAAERGASALVIQADPHALPFYTAAGALVTGKRESASIPGRYLPILRLQTSEPDGAAGRLSERDSVVQDVSAASTREKQDLFE